MSPNEGYVPEFFQPFLNARVYDDTTSLMFQLFYQTQFFFVTTTLVNELKEKLGIKLNDDSLKTEFYKMEEWLKKNGAKKDYKRFFINWLSKLKSEQPKQETKVWS